MITVLSAVFAVAFIFIAFLIKERSMARLRVGTLTIVVSLVPTILVYAVSLGMGRDGFSIFASQELVDDKLYFYSAKLLAAQFWERGLFDIEQIFEMQRNDFGYASTKSLFYSSLAVPFYILFPDSGPLGFILFNALFFALISNLLLRDILITRETLITDKNNRTLESSVFSSFSIFFVLWLIMYPNFTIRVVQVEKDIFLTFFFIAAFFHLKWSYVDRSRKIGWVSLCFLYCLLFLYRPQFAVVIMGVQVYLQFFMTAGFLKIILYSSACCALFPLALLGIKSWDPALFDLLVRMKRFSVMAGVTDFLHVDYSSYLNICETLVTSAYYFLFAPISSYTLQANALWNLMMIEPIVFFVLPVVLSLHWHAYIPNGKKIICVLVILTILLTLFSIVFESHVGGYFRKRIPIYLLWQYCMFLGLACKRAQLINQRGRVFGQAGMIR